MEVTKFIERDNARTVVGTLRPSGRFSVCQVFPKKYTGHKEVSNVPSVSGALLTVEQLDANYKRLLSGKLDNAGGVLSSNTEYPAALGSSIAVNSPKRASRGFHGINARQRDILCWSANSLERMYGQRLMSFLTLTLPDLEELDFYRVRDAWSDIVNRVTLRIKEKLSARGVTTAIVGCTELQMERAEACGRFYPHLHMVFRGKASRASDWAIDPIEFREIWENVVGKYINQSSVDWQASENVQQVKKSSGGYLAKYISKCGSKGRGGVLDSWHPSDWIICSRRLRTLYSQLTRKGYDMGQVLLAVVREWQHGFGYKKPIVISTPAYGDRTIGTWGWLKDELTFPDYFQLHPPIAQ